MFFTHKTVKKRINEIHRLIGKLSMPEYDDLNKRGAKVKEIRFKLLSLIKAEQKIAAEFKAVLRDMDDTYNVS